MAIEATIRRSYAVRLIILAAVCAVLGVWGVYDYAVAIPRKRVTFERAELLRRCRSALETEQPAGTFLPEAKSAYDDVLTELNAQLAPLFAGVQKGRVISSQEELQSTMADLGAAIEASPDARWIALLATLVSGLPAERKLPLINYPEAHAAFEAAQRGIDQFGKVTAPSGFDRATQWAFIMCLPCVPYFLWIYVATKRRGYRLAEDGTLETPEGTWPAADIADIDMSRWMAKSIATVIHREGSRIKLDDYKFRNLHLIVGAIACRLHPDQWDAEAKPLGKESAEPALAGIGEAPAGGGTDGRGTDEVK